MKDPVRQRQQRVFNRCFRRLFCDLQQPDHEASGCGIRAKMRSIDEIGWLDEKKIGVLLPVTNFQGGRRFVTRVCESERFSLPFDSLECPYVSPALALG